MSTQTSSVLSVSQLTRELKVGEVTVRVLRGVSLTIERGAFVAIMGPSGSGKSTLLGILGGLDAPTSGSVVIDGVDVTKMGERELTRVRNQKIGFVFQQFNLVPTLTALENVMLPIQFAHRPTVANPAARARELLAALGLGERLGNRPAQLSGGQQQRVAIARALANNPPLLLADEPTGNLDSASADAVMRTLREVQRTRGATLVMVTHNPEIAATADRVITLVDGAVAGDERTGSALLLGQPATAFAAQR